MCGSGVKTSGRGKIILLAPKVYVGLYGARVKKRRPKMLKRSIIGLTVVALLACIPQVWAGGDKSESWDYTISFVSKEAYRFDVKVKVPWWIKMQPQDPIMLTQVAFYEIGFEGDSSKYLKAKYEGTTTTNVIGNYAAILSTSKELSDVGGVVGGDWTIKLNNADTVTTQAMVSLPVVIKVTIDKIDLSMKTPCETLVLGQVIVKVKPVGISVTYTCCP
jgi:hypothetical protein